MTAAKLWRRRLTIAAVGALEAIGVAPARGQPIAPLTYLLPAPQSAIVFAPFLLAQKMGLYAQRSLNVRFVVVPGGVNAGTALARGEGDLAGAVGDTPMLLRAKGINVRGVALLGQHSFLTVITRQGMMLDNRLKGKEIDVPAYKDTSFYALSALLREISLKPGDVTVKAGTAGELIGWLGAGKIDGVVGTVDWGVKAERAGAALDYRSLESAFPALAQVVLASDTTIVKRPTEVRAFVSATLDAIRAIEADPETTATDYAAAVPNSGYSHSEIVRIFSLLSSHVYGDTRRLGRFDPAVMRAAANANVLLGLMSNGSHVGQSYTNSFVERAAR